MRPSYDTWDVRFPAASVKESPDWTCLAVARMPAQIMLPFDGAPEISRTPIPENVPAPVNGPNVMALMFVALANPSVVHHVICWRV